MTSKGYSQGNKPQLRFQTHEVSEIHTFFWSEKLKQKCPDFISLQIHNFMLSDILTFVFDFQTKTDQFLGV